MPFCHLQIRSAYSFHFGPRAVNELVREAAAMGYRQLALTDLDNLYGAHLFEEACQEAGISPIFGLELSDHGPLGMPRPGERAILLAHNRQGFSRLCELVTWRRQAVFDFKLIELVPAESQNLTILTDSPRYLETWYGQIERLYGLITPTTTQAVLTARRLGLPLAASCEASLIDPEIDRDTQRLLVAIGSLRPLAAISDREISDPRHCLLPPDQASRCFADFPDAAENSQRIAQSIEPFSLFGGFIYPARKLGPNHDSLSELRQRVSAGAIQRYGEIGDAVSERISYELEIINSKGFTEYFLIVADIVGLASRTCGRGSGAASIVAYCLGITNVDPIAHNLYFERFLNRDRSDPPDIDIDFAWDERDGIMQAVIERYGAEHCARVANHLHYQFRSALRETARASGIPEGETTAYYQKLRRLGLSESTGTWAEIQTLAQRITGLPHGLSVHSGGMVITREPIRRHAPIEQAPSATILAWEKEGTESAGLIKIDLLGNRSLAVIRDAIANLAEHGIVIDPFDWHPQTDPATRELLAKGLSIGVFYIESPAMRQLQLKTGIGDFEHIVIHSSIIRPAANRFINEYVRRLKGGAWEPLHPLLDGLLNETYGIMCYQEDISKAAIALAGFGEGDADKLRKIVSKKSPAKLREYEERFRQGAQERGIGADTIQKIWEMILSFEGYSFCKPHSASYAMVSFQSAWLKAHHGPEFMAAVLSNQGGFYTPSAYISEIRRLEIGVQGPDVNASRYNYHAENGQVRIGLMAIAGLGQAVAKNLVENRQNQGHFRSLADLASRLAMGRDDCQALAEAGALDSLEPSLSRSAILRALLVAQRRETVQPKINNGLFAADPPQNYGPPPAIQTKPVPRQRRELLLELGRLGYLIEHHPLVLWRDRRIAGCILAREIAARIGKRIQIVAWLVTRKEVQTKHGEAMEFVSFEDESAIFEAVLFPEAYERHSALLYSSQPLLLTGKVQDDMGAIYLDVQAMSGLGELQASTVSPI